VRTLQQSRDYFSHQRPEVVGLLPRGVDSVLDVGCGAGAFGALIKKSREEKFVRVVGVDRNHVALQEAEKVLDRVICFDLRSGFPDVEEAFDCIVFNDVLEHLEDPGACLTSAMQYLAPEGHVLVSIPNVRNHKVLRKLVLSGRWEYEDEGILDRTHLRFFTRSSAIELLGRAGLEVAECIPIGRSRFPRWLAIMNFVMGNSLEDLRFQQFLFLCTRGER